MKTANTLLLAVLTAFTMACGYSSKSTPPTAGTMPAIAQLSPTDATAGGAAFMLTVNGMNFTSQAVVNFNGAALPTTFVTGSQLTAAIPASSIATSGTAKVTVTNPGAAGNGIYGGGTLAETSAAVNFTIN
jgi:hypothetical protein